MSHDHNIERKIDDVQHKLALHQQECVHHRVVQNNTLDGILKSIEGIKRWQRISSVIAYIIGTVMLVGYLFGVEGIQNALGVIDAVKP